MRIYARALFLSIAFHRPAARLRQKCLDIFNALGVKDVYAPKRKQGESEH
jgi:hypothetical protein